MDLLGLYSKTDSGKKSMLTLICMLTNYVYMIPIKTNTIEDVINAYVKHVYAIFSGSKYILSNSGGEFSSKQFTW